jgi:hypothetical protein
MAKKKAKNKIEQTGEKASKDIIRNELTEQEKARLDHYYQRSQKKSIKFKTEKSASDSPAITFDNPDSLNNPLTPVKMLEALGTPDSDLQQQLLNQVIQTFKGIGSTEGIDNDKIVPAINNAMAILNGIEPQDEIEGMLAVQMIGVHNLAMDSIQRAMLVGQTFNGRKVNVEHATKMIRTFMMQIETLKNYRAKGFQKMVIGNVGVSEGGQAIVGTINQSVDKKVCKNELSGE